MAERTMTVSELNGLVKQILESDELLRRVAVTGEISNF
jgi:exonuclease VII large subunit